MTTLGTIGEINIICTDLERSLAFYRDVLGFEVLAREPRACHLRCGHVDFLLLALAQSRPPNQPYGQTPEFSVDLLVDDLAAVVAEFNARGVEFVGEWAVNATRAFIRDPDGLVWEVIQR